MGLTFSKAIFQPHKTVYANSFSILYCVLYRRGVPVFMCTEVKNTLNMITNQTVGTNILVLNIMDCGLIKQLHFFLLNHYRQKHNRQGHPWEVTTQIQIPYERRIWSVIVCATVCRRDVYILFSPFDDAYFILLPPRRTCTYKCFTIDSVFPRGHEFLYSIFYISICSTHIILFIVGIHVSGIR